MLSQIKTEMRRELWAIRNTFQLPSSPSKPDATRQFFWGGNFHKLDAQAEHPLLLWRAAVCHSTSPSPPQKTAIKNYQQNTDHQDAFVRKKNIFQTSNYFGTASSVWCPPSKAHSRRWQQASQEAPAAAAAAATAKGQRIQISWQKKFQRQWLDFNDHLRIGTGGSCSVVPKKYLIQWIVVFVTSVFNQNWG